MITRLSAITVLPGVGKVRAQAYEKIGVFTLGDLLLHYPRAYENRGDIYTLADAAQRDGKSALILTVGTAPKIVRLRSHKSFLKFRAFDESASCEIVYFNQDYLKSNFVPGAEFRFYGKVEVKGRNSLTLSSPVAEPIFGGAKLKPYCAVYSATEGLTPKQIAKDVAMAFELLQESDLEDPLPQKYIEKYSFCNLFDAEREIHCPETAKSLLEARRRLVYQEFFDFALGASISKQRAKQHKAPICKKADLQGLYAALPYALTSAQERVIAEISSDMAKDEPMSRMVVGDVGCGKTVCAAAAMLIAMQNGRQAVLMAPTEILARQHFSELSVLFEKLGYQTKLLVGATTAAEKRKIKEALASENPEERLDAVIGTHALLSQGVEFFAPGVVITDEQHRFGARQRAVLAQKNMHAHLLVMSATPIPRSLALVLYGDLDLSKIDEMPKGRQRVDTFVVDESYRQRLNAFIGKQVEEGGQVYVVCPAVEEETPDLGEMCLRDFYLQEEPVTKAALHSAIEFSKTLSEQFPNYRVAYLHGKMKSGEKDAVMKSFASGEIQILVSTTVIEVGVNVPNATLMIVENAERFGLSQLHQLRGRVGRGNRKSYCILVCAGEGDLGQTAKERLEIMRTTYDGYAIAEKDLSQRGPGDFLGTSQGTLRQSGTLAFRLADTKEDCEWMMAATADAKELIAEDALLLQYPVEKERIFKTFSTESGLIS